MIEREDRTRIIERVKTVLLVVLTLSTILLLYFFWEGNSNTTVFQLSDVTAFIEEEVYVPSVEDVIVPREILVNFKYNYPMGEYTSINHDKRNYWNQAVKELKQFCKATNIQVTELSASKYVELMELRSIQFNFSYDIPFSDFCDKYQIRRFQGSDSIQYISSLSYCSDTDDSLFFYDRKSDKYYRMFVDIGKKGEKTSGNHSGFSSMIDGVEKEGNYATYYQAGAYMLGTEGTKSKNHAVIPVNLSSNLLAFSYEPEFTSSDEEKINEFAEKFYGKNFDFTRRITESQGTIIFMYGYGQKVLVAGTDGTLEYKEEVSEDLYTDENFFSSLQIALQFIASHGSWKLENGQKSNPEISLREATVSEQGKKKEYRFVFDMELEGRPIYLQNGSAAIVKVVGSQVTYYKRNMELIDFSQADYALKNTEYKETMDAVNTIAQNYEYISEFLLEKGIIDPSALIGKEKTDTPYLEAIVDSMYYMQAGYVRNAEVGKIIPAWIISFANPSNTKKCDLYFKLYPKGNAEPVGFNDNGDKSQGAAK